MKVIKGNSDFFAEQVCTYFHESITSWKFPNCLKLANITPAFKKGTLASKNITFSKICEKLLFFGNISSKFQCGFGKDYLWHTKLLITDA